MVDLRLEVVLNVILHSPPRRFRVGPDGHIELCDCARIELAPDEQVTFTTDGGGQYDVARKSWGFYATPSLNARLPRYGLRPVLVKGLENKFFIMLVERGHERDFHAYVAGEGLMLIHWLDDDTFLCALEQQARG